MKKIGKVFLLFLFSTSAIHAQLPAKVENFTLLNVASNKMLSLSEFTSQKAVVVIFTSNYCPYSKLYEDRIIALAKTFESQGVKFLLINSNTSIDNIDDSVEEMAKRITEKQLTFPYLADKDQKVAMAFGVLKNPEVFVLQPVNGVFSAKYRGAIDNNPQLAEEVTEFYLRDILLALVNRKNLPYTEKKPTGCIIKKE